MRSLKDLLARPSMTGADYIYRDDLGYIAWRFGTGENLEILFVEAARPGNGAGRELVRMMCRHCLAMGRLPYHSVYAFRLGSREGAGRFYRGMGFKEYLVGLRSVYRDDSTVLHVTEWADLLKELGCD